MFRERVSQQTVGIHLETNRLFFYSNEADFIQGLLHKTNRNLSDLSISI